MSSLADHLWVEFRGDLTADFSTNSHCHPLVDGLPVISFFLCCLLQRVYAVIKADSVLEGSLAES
jgi:hypothetical protein